MIKILKHLFPTTLRVIEMMKAMEVIAKALIKAPATMNRAGGIGPAAPVLAGPVFSQGKSIIPFLQKASNK